MNKVLIEFVPLFVFGANKECDKVITRDILIFTFIFQQPLPLWLAFSFEIFFGMQLGKDARSGRAFVFVLGHNKSLCSVTPSYFHIWNKIAFAMQLPHVWN